jgi:hypothetical protein
MRGTTRTCHGSIRTLLFAFLVGRIAPDRRHHAFLCNPQCRKVGTNRVGDIARRQAGVVLFWHVRVGMPRAARL